jgi:hypothetical protein
MRSHKNTPIHYTIEQLANYAETPLFIDMVIQNKWLENIYTNDWSQNDRLRFIRKWWSTHMREVPPVKNKEKNLKRTISAKTIEFFFFLAIVFVKQI